MVSVQSAIDRLDSEPPNPAPAPNKEGDAEDEAYEIGKRDGYEQAVQDIDLMTGGDGEYRFCTDHDPDRHTPDAEAMKARIVARIEELRAATIPAPERSKEEAGVRVKPLEWVEDEIGWWCARPDAMLHGYEVRITDRGKVRSRRGTEPWADFDGTLDEAKAAHQAHFDQCILSALETPPLHKEGEAVGYVSQTTLAHLKVGTSAVACSIYGAPVSIHNIPLYAAPVPVPVTITPEQAAIDALQPFHDSVFNDNGDITVNGPYDYEFAVAAYFAHRKLTAALSLKPGATK